MTSRPQFAAALSRHPLATQAVGETVGALLEALRLPPDLVLVFASAEHHGAFEDITRAVRTLLNPRVLLGAVTPTVSVGGDLARETSGIAVWAGVLGRDIEPIRLEAFRPEPDRLLVTGGGALAVGAGTLLLLCEPGTFPLAEVTAHLNEALPELTLLGGAPTIAPGGPLMVLDDERFRDGAVGVFLPAAVDTESVSSFGVEPIGDLLTVTGAEGSMLLELGGQPALIRLMEQLDRLEPEQRRAAAAGIYVGVADDERSDTVGPAERSVFHVVGADREREAIALEFAVGVGQALQFMIPCVERSGLELEAMVAAIGAETAFVISHPSRVERRPDTDTEALQAALGDVPTIGITGIVSVGPGHIRNVVIDSGAAALLFGPN